MIIKWIYFVIFVARISCGPLKNLRDDTEIGYRLPRTIEPTNYAINLVLNSNIFNDNVSNSVQGSVLITYNVLQTTDTLYLHVNPEFLQIYSIIFDTVAGEYSINATTNIIAITGTYTEGTSGSVRINYEANVSVSDMYGFYKSSYEEDGVTKYLLTTQFQTTYARRIFPCFDEPSFKATFDITITYPTNERLVPLGNTPVQGTPTVDQSTGTTTVQFQQTPIMSTYLVAFIISEFTSSGDGDVVGVAGVPHNVWSRSSTESTRALAVEYGAPILQALNEYTNLSYSSYLPKMDQVAIPDFAAGAMENFGLVTYRETALLWDENHSSNSYKQRVLTVVAHEFSHMWFGDIVTTNWWADTFLNEGFARYFQYYITDEVVPSWELTKQFVVEQHQTSLETDSLESAQALHSEANTPAEVSAKFGTISYSKGGSIFRMVHHFLGQEQYQAGLRAYLDKYQTGYTTPENLWESLNEFVGNNLPAGTDLATVMENYVYQSGYPVVTVSLTDSGTIQLNQTRFLIQNPTTTRATADKWYVPISYTTSAEKDFETTSPKAWLLPDEDLALTNAAVEDWILLNIQETAYYRVNYETTLWERLAAALLRDNFDSIPDVNRAQIVDDLFALTRAGYVSYKQAFSYVDFLKNDVSYYPWYSAFTAFNYILKKVGSTSDLGVAIYAHIRELMESLYTSVSSQDDAEDQVYTLKRVLAYSWACKLGYESCLSYAKEEFANYVSTGVKPNKNLRTTIYCYGLRNSDSPSEHWNYLWSEYSNTDLQTEQVTILSALGCTEDETLLRNYLELSIDSSSGIRSQDASSAYSAVYSSGPVGLRVAYNFLKERYTDIQASYSSMSSLNNLILGIAGYFTTQEQVDDLEQFINEAEGLHDSFVLAAASALETARSNILWVANNQDDLNDHFGIDDSTDEEVVDIGYRLPRTIVPTLYGINLVLNENIFADSVSNSFTGSATIQYQVLQTTDTLYLHIDPEFLSITSILPTAEYSLNATTNLVAISGTYTQGVSGSLTINFESRVSVSDMYGFYKSSYEENGVTKYLLTTQFQTTYARRVFPCFDEPSFKAPFVISITYPTGENLVPLGNTPVQGTPTVDESAGTTTVQFQQTPIMSTYLIAFIISEFTSSGDGDVVGVAGVPHNVWSRSDTESTRALAVDYGARILQALNEYTDLSYSSYLPKMDQVAIPDFAAGAMENFGLVTYRETYLLWDENHSSNRYKQYVLTIIAHEFAHMWFGDIVTTNWWADTFLNEGFATYFEYHITDKVVPTWELAKQFVLDDHQNALEADCLETAQALHSEANTPAEVSAKFGTISYSKGGSIFRMVHHFLGEEQYQAGLRAYLSTYQTRYTTPENLWESMNEFVGNNLPAGTDLTTVMENYVYQAGYPVVTVSLTDSGSIQLSQTRFLIQNPTSRATADKWYVPISYTTSAEKDFETTLADAWLLPDEDLTLNAVVDDWIILNIQESAYYRVNYDTTLWERLAAALLRENFDSIHELNRAQIVDDLFALTRAGYVNYQQSFTYVDFLKNDVSYYPWYSAFTAFNFILKKVGSTSDLGVAIYAHIRELMESLYTSVSSQDDAEDQVYTLTRVLAYSWACKLGYESCLSYAKEEFANYVSTGVKPNKNLRTTIYCYGLRNSDSPSEHWHYLWSEYSNTDLQTEKVTILSALGCTEDESLLTNYLELSIDSSSGIRSQDAYSAYSSVYSSGPVGLQVAYNFLKERYADIQASYTSMSSLGNLIRGIAGYFTTQEQVDDLEQFINEAEGLHDSFVLAATGALETARSNILWVANNQDDLNDHFGVGTVSSSSSSSTSTTSTPTQVPNDPSTSSTTQAPVDPSTPTEAPDSASVKSVSLTFILLLLALSFFINV